MSKIRIITVLAIFAIGYTSKSNTLSQSFLQETGGMVDIPPQGCVLIANCQTKLNDNVFSKQIDRLKSVTHVNFKTISVSKFDLFTTVKALKKQEKASVAVFIVDEPNLPVSIVAPEENWGIVNIAAITATDGDNTISTSRAQIAFMRTSILTLGAWTSDGNSILKGVTDLSQLDSLKGKSITLFEIRDIMNHLLLLGIKRGYSTTYRQAYMEGLAPAPTNDYQRAIIEQVKADKERGPTNPIKIPMPKKRK
jgi:hypothetical protein